MKYFISLFLVSIAIISCGPVIDQETAENSGLAFDAFPLQVPEQHALMTKWEQKKVLSSELIDDMEKDKDWQLSGIGKMSYTSDRAKDGKRSLRFRTSLRDEEYYRQNRSEWDSFIGRQGGRSSVQLRFEKPQDWSEFNRISFWAYVHPTSMPTYCIYLKLECEGAIRNATTYNGKSHFVQDLKPGEWNHILFEIPHLQRDKVTSFTINQMLVGHNPEEEGIVTYDFDQLEIQRVVADQYEGWQVATDKFSFSHVGYQPSDPKVALVSEGAADQFQLVDMQDNVVFTNDVQEVENERGKFHLLDFTEFNNQGSFRMRTGALESEPFPIQDDIWYSPIFKTINFFFCQRCGYAVPGVHLECHKDWQGFYGDNKKIINGGWHDAGDLSQGSWRTAMSTLAMMMHLEGLQGRPEYEELADRLRTEIAWGLEWLLKTRFGDGYHMSFSVMRIYTDNEVGTIDDVVTPAKNVPWENFLASAVQAKAAMLLESSHPELAEQSRIAAIEDWEAAMASRDLWDEADYREAAWGATSSLILGRMTGDEKYNQYAVDFGNLLIQCQEQRFLDGIPITGYFYTTSAREQVIHNRHAAFEEAPLIALAMLCREFSDHENWMEWYSAAVLHSEFFLKRGSQIASPYDLLPNSVWKESEILSVEDEQRRTDMLRQFNDGTRLNDEYVLRTFPIYSDNLFHGNTNIHMSNTWALAEASRLRNDSAGMQLVGKQFRWIFGANPFGQSLMYGEGYDFAPHFAYCLKDLVGALPVGMDCMSGDDPHWSATNAATYKEIWVEPVNRFLGAVSVYLSEPGSVAAEKELEESIALNIKVFQPDGQSFPVAISASGSGQHVLEFSAFNATLDIERKSLNLDEGVVEGTVSDLSIDGVVEGTVFEMSVIDGNKPYVVIISVDNDPKLRREIVGSFVDSPFSPGSSSAGM